MVKKIGTEKNPLRVAIIGAGPAGFYTADSLLNRNKTVAVSVDMFDRLPTPFGLVRAGIAPDHQKIKSVSKVFHKIAQLPNFRYFGYVELGKDISVNDLRAHYHQIVYTVGTESAKKLGLPGEDLEGSHSATEFVAWLNGHPDYKDCQFDLTQENAAIIGVGNVAMDVARMLTKTPDELQKTDITDHALKALMQSNVKRVYILGRRGPAQAAFTIPELKEMGLLANTTAKTRPEDMILDDYTLQLMERDGQVRRKMEILQTYIAPEDAKKSRHIEFRFFVSPVKFLDDGNGHLKGLRVVKNKIVDDGNGRMKPRATDDFEVLPVGLVFRSIGYRGEAIRGVPFHQQWGIIPNEAGRVINPNTHYPRLGEYTAGWIKRGPSGIVGTNKPDAAETVRAMLTDAAEGKLLEPSDATLDAAKTMVSQKQPQYFSYADWEKLDALEIERGQAQGRPRVKFTDISEMLKAVGKTS